MEINSNMHQMLISQIPVSKVTFAGMAGQNCFCGWRTISNDKAIMMIIELASCWRRETKLGQR